jgi:hypothetical protein
MLYFLKKLLQINEGNNEEIVIAQKGFNSTIPIKLKKLLDLLDNLICTPLPLPHDFKQFKYVLLLLSNHLHGIWNGRYLMLKSA